MSTVLEVKDLCKTYVTNKRQNNVLTLQQAEQFFSIIRISQR